MHQIINCFEKNSYGFQEAIRYCQFFSIYPPKCAGKRNFKILNANVFFANTDKLQ